MIFSVLLALSVALMFITIICTKLLNSSEVHIWRFDCFFFQELFRSRPVIEDPFSEVKSAEADASMYAIWKSPDMAKYAWSSLVMRTLGSGRGRVTRLSVISLNTFSIVHKPNRHAIEYVIVICVNGVIANLLTKHKFEQLQRACTYIIPFAQQKCLLTIPCLYEIDRQIHQKWSQFTAELNPWSSK